MARGNELTILLVGKTGSGKSATGNTILNHNRFPLFLEQCSFNSVTRKSQRRTRDVDDRTIAVIDTPGLFHTSMTDEEVKAEIEEGIKLSYPGLHVILLVISLSNRFSAEESKAVEWFQKSFGEDVLNYTMVLFTHGETLGRRTVDQCLNERPELKGLVDQCKGGYHVFQNKNEAQAQGQVRRLLRKIDRLEMNDNNRLYKSGRIAALMKCVSVLVRYLPLTRVLMVLGLIVMSVVAWKVKQYIFKKRKWS